MNNALIFAVRARVLGRKERIRDSGGDRLFAAGLRIQQYRSTDKGSTYCGTIYSRVIRSDRGYKPRLPFISEFERGLSSRSQS